jgi:protein-L-isoaspartate O-methyltransferase
MSDETALWLKTISNEVVCAFDVDQTLVIWSAKSEREKTGMAIVNPYDGQEVWCSVHEPHVRLIKQMKSRGRFVIVWSAGGAQWAASVVGALGLTSFVDQIMTKPIAYVDDVPVDQWMSHRIFIPYEETK